MRKDVAVGLPGSEPDDGIIWQDADNTYKPALRPLAEFLSAIQAAHDPAAVSLEHASLLVFVEESCVRAMEAHACNDILNEQAGIICGHAYMDPGGRLYVAVSSVLPAEIANGPAHFRFHEGSWQKLWGQIKDGSNMLGWYHTHPGMGVFLSATDLRTQQLYFGAPWQIAIVLDPVRREIAVFHGAEGKRLPQENLVVYSTAT